MADIFRKMIGIGGSTTPKEVIEIVDHLMSLEYSLSYYAAFNNNQDF